MNDTTALAKPYSHILKEFNTFFLSEVLYLKVYDNEDNVIGHINDIAIDLRLNFRHPYVSAFTIKSGRQKSVAVDPESIVEYRLDYFKLSKNPRFLNKFDAEDKYEGDNEILLNRDILDKQIVDTGGLKIVRVNDVKLTFVKSKIIAIGPDIGASGLLRRLSIERIVKSVAAIFNKKIPDKIISWQFVEPIGISASCKLKLSVPHAKLSLLHPADIADIMEDLSIQESSEIFKSLDEETAAETLSEIDESELQVSLIESLDTAKAADILEMMPPDEVADILGDMAEQHAEEILSDMNSQGAEEVRELMSHDEDTAGGLMTNEYISFPEYFNVEQALSEFRLLAPNTEMTYYLYIEEKGGYIKGVVTLKDLVMARPFQKLTEIMNRKIVSVLLTDPKEEVAEKIGHYNLMAIPVVNEDDAIQGVITLDDVIDIIAEKKEMLPHFMKGSD